MIFEKQCLCIINNLAKKVAHRVEKSMIYKSCTRRFILIYHRLPLSGANIPAQGNALGFLGITKKPRAMP